MTTGTKLDADIAKLCWRRVYSLAGQMEDILRDLEAVHWCNLARLLKERSSMEFDPVSVKEDALLRKAKKL